MENDFFLLFETLEWHMNQCQTILGSSEIPTRYFFLPFNIKIDFSFSTVLNANFVLRIKRTVTNLMLKRIFFQLECVNDHNRFVKTQIIFPITVAFFRSESRKGRIEFIMIRYWHTSETDKNGLD